MNCLYCICQTEFHVQPTSLLIWGTCQAEDVPAPLLGFFAWGDNRLHIYCHGEGGVVKMEGAEGGRGLSYLANNAQCPTFPVGSGSSTYSVHIVSSLNGEVKIDHKIHTGNVQTSACHICCQQDGDTPRLESADQS